MVRYDKKYFIQNTPSLDVIVLNRTLHIKICTSMTLKIKKNTLNQFFKKSPSPSSITRNFWHIVEYKIIIHEHMIVVSYFIEEMSQRSRVQKIIFFFFSFSSVAVAFTPCAAFTIILFRAHEIGVKLKLKK